jgi:hypothetical protein
VPTFVAQRNVLFGPVKMQGRCVARTIVASPEGFGAYAISGVSRDAQGNILPLVTCLLYATGTDRLVAKRVSEAVTGAFAFVVPDKVTTYYIVFLSADGTLGGTTVNTLVGS